MKTVDDIAAELESRFSHVMDTLGNQQDVIQLKYDVWDSAFGGASSEAERLAKQLESLAAQQEIQKTRVDAAKAAYDKIVSVYGAASAEATEYEKPFCRRSEPIRTCKMRSTRPRLRSTAIRLRSTG